MFYNGRLAMPLLRRGDLKHAISLFRAGGGVKRCAERGRVKLMRRLILAAVTAFVAVCAKHVRADSVGEWYPSNSTSITVDGIVWGYNAIQRGSSYEVELYWVSGKDKCVINIPGSIPVQFQRERTYYDEGVRNMKTIYEYKTETCRVIELTGGVANSTTITIVTIPPSVTSIGDYAFSGCSSLSSVTIPPSVTSIGDYAFSGCSSLSSVTIPPSVTSIGDCAFSGCSSLSSVTISSGVTSIGDSVFSGCRSLPSVTIPSNVVHIGSSAFSGCRSLSSVAIPSGVTNIGSSAFYANSSLGSVDIGTGVKTVGAECFCSCMNLTNVIFRGDAPTTVGGLVFSETSLDLNVVVPRLRSGWTGPDGVLPARWPYNTETGRYIRYVDEPVISSERIVEVQLSVTNIVVNYILNSVQPELAVPISPDTGFVTVVTEVKGNTKGVVAVPDSWSASFPNFHKRFGGNFAEAVTRQTGKRDAVGNPMQVWQDFVAGTDPTDEKDVFTASVTMVDGKPVVSWTPELRPEEAAKRKYTTYGKVRLQDKQWVEVPVGHEKDYNFFKVSVEMR